ncbi:MAG: hypothetical protein H7Y30_16670, partial [Pyrinomonadaceae bacterium]|nr:hypothetical protein [Pyrinomonadaceae bacterium]
MIFKTSWRLAVSSWQKQLASYLLFPLRLCVSALMLTCLVSVCAFGQTAPAPQKAKELPPVPKKSNERPAETPANVAEPFDGASIEKMAAQCVTLET